MVLKGAPEVDLLDEDEVGFGADGSWRSGVLGECWGQHRREHEADESSLHGWEFSVNKGDCILLWSSRIVATIVPFALKCASEKISATVGIKCPDVVLYQCAMLFAPCVEWEFLLDGVMSE